MKSACRIFQPSNRYMVREQSSGKVIGTVFSKDIGNSISSPNATKIYIENNEGLSAVFTL